MCIRDRSPTPFVDIAVGSSPFGVELFDADADGDLDLFVTAASAVVLENDGTGTFSIQHSVQSFGSGRAAVDDISGDGHPDLAWTEFTTSGMRVWLNCGTNGIPFCFGDGSGTACPCGNTSAAGAQ